MQAIIMAGGEGSRLRPLTCDRPKPMVPLVNKPVMEHTVDLLRSLGWTDIGVTLQYLPQEIIDYFGNGSRFGVQMQYFVEDTPLGTAGSVKNADSFLNDTFLVISGDALTDFDLQAALEFHRAKGSWATLILKKVKIPLEYGVVITADGGNITQFLEKPGWGEVFSDTVNTGIYILEPQVLEYVPEATKFDFSKDLFPLLMKEGRPMFGYQADGYWCDIGSIDQYQQANIDVLLGRAKVPGLRENSQVDGIWVGQNVSISTNAEINCPVIIGDGSVIEAGAKVGPHAVIGANCRIGHNASVVRSVLWNGVTVGSMAHVKGAVLCSQVKVHARSSVYEGAVLGDRAIVESMARVRPGVKIWPEKIIKKDTILRDNLVWGNFGSRNVFGSKGITGSVNAEIIPEYAARVGAAFGASMGMGSEVIISGNAGPGSEMIKLALTSGLISVGCNVVDIGETTMPVHRFGIRQVGAKGGIHVEQSGENINIRMSDNRGIPISRNVERKIESNLQREDFLRAAAGKFGKIKYVKKFPRAYINHLAQMTNQNKINQRSPKVVVRYSGHKEELGMEIVIPLLEGLGCRVITVSDDSVRERVLKEKADIGVILNESGEAFDLIDEKGRLFEKEHYLTLTASLMLNQNKNMTVAVPVTVPGLIEVIAEKKGGRVIRTKSSPQQYFEELMREELVRNQQKMPQYLLAFDGFAGLLGLVEFIASEDTSLASFLDSLPEVFGSKKSVDCSWEDKGTVMRSLIQEHASEKVELIDGIKVFKDNGWALILPDAEEPLYHVYSEGTDFEIAESLADFYMDKIKQIVGAHKESL